MKLRFSSLFLTAAAAAFALAASSATANVYIDEDFEATPILADGVTVDTYDASLDGSPTATLITETGSRVTSTAFAGSASYELSPGESITVADGYPGQGGGNLVYFQFGLSVDSIPAAGNVARFEYNTELDSTPHRFFVELTSTGSQIDVTGGEDLAGSSSGAVTTITAADTWTFITVQIFVHNVAANDNRPQVNQASISPGVYFYADSTTPSSSAAITGAATKDGNGWSFTVDGGTTATVYLDELYWSGGMDADYDFTSPTNTDRGDLQAFDTAPSAASVENWQMFE